LDLEPEKDFLYLQRSDAFSNLGDKKRAIEDLNSYLKITDRPHPAYERRATIRRDLGQIEESLKDFRSAELSDPTCPHIFAKRAELLERIGDLGGALTDLDKSIKLNGRYYLERAIVRSRLGDRPGAIADLDVAISMNPNWSEAYKRRAVLRLEALDPVGAAQDFRSYFRSRR